MIAHAMTGRRDIKIIQFEMFRGKEYTCTIGVAKKGAKFGGFKAYMTYPVTPSFNNIQVSIFLLLILIKNKK